MDLTQLAEQTRALALDILHQSAIGEGQIFVLGLSTSEVVGGRIGKNSNQEVGEVIVKTLLDILNEHKIYLACKAASTSTAPWPWSGSWPKNTGWKL